MQEAKGDNAVKRSRKRKRSQTENGYRRRQLGRFNKRRAS